MYGYQNSPRQANGQQDIGSPATSRKHLEVAGDGLTGSAEPRPAPELDADAWDRQCSISEDQGAALDELLRCCAERPLPSHVRKGYSCREERPTGGQLQGGAGRRPVHDCKDHAAMRTCTCVLTMCLCTFRPLPQVVEAEEGGHPQAGSSAASASGQQQQQHAHYAPPQLPAGAPADTNSKAGVSRGGVRRVSVQRAVLRETAQFYEWHNALMEQEGALRSERYQRYAGLLESYCEVRALVTPRRTCGAGREPTLAHAMHTHTHAPALDTRTDVCGPGGLGRRRSRLELRTLTSFN